MNLPRSRFLQSYQSLKQSPTWPVVIILLTAAASALMAFRLLKFVDQSTVFYFSDAKIRWKECYLKVENVDQCNQEASLSIYPQTDAYMLSRLDYFKKNHLNLYLDAP